MKISDRYIKMCEIYKIFAKDWDCDFSKEAMEDMYAYETFGAGNIDISGFNAIGKKSNGYAIGKKWLNVTVAMWMEECEKRGWHPTLQRIYSDETFPHWWLDEVFSSYIGS